MMLKKSLYNIEVDACDNGDILMFNSYSLAFGKMDGPTKTLYTQTDLFDEDSFLDPKQQKAINVMKENGFLVDVDFDEYASLRFLGNVSRFRGGFSLTIAPTLACNMACPYCFEKKRNVRMNAETRDELAKFVRANLERLRSDRFGITWYGGEPLLELETIEFLSNKFIAICDEMGVDYRADIITNGILLDAGAARLLSHLKVRTAQVTVDGLEQQHNSRRLLKNGTNSFTTIINNIDEARHILDLTIRVNVDKDNTADASDLVDYFIDEKKWGESLSFYFSMVYPSKNACLFDQSRCYSSSEFATVSAGLLWKSFHKKIASRCNCIYPTRINVPCGGVCMEQHVIDPIGNLYACWHNVCEPEKKIGHITTGPQMNSEFLKWKNFESPQECRTCAKLPLCQGGCPLKVFEGDGHPGCNRVAENLKETLKIYYADYKNRQMNKNVDEKTPGQEAV